MKRLLHALFSFGSRSDEPWRRRKAAGSKAYRQGDYAEAEKQLTLALEQAELFGAHDPRLAVTLNNLGLVYKKQDKLGKAELFLRRALRVYKDLRGNDVLAVSMLRNLAVVHIAQGAPGQAKLLLKQARAISRRNAFGKP